MNDHGNETQTGGADATRPDATSKEASGKRPGRRPTGIRVLVAVNALAAIVLLLMFPQYTGGRALLYLCVGILHAVLSAGLFLQSNWARIMMIIYALFQVAGMGLWSLIGLMTLAVQPLSSEKAQFLALSAAAIPFLIWSALYLLRQLRNGAASQRR